MTEQTIALQSYLTFKLENEIFAANVSKVLEILEIPRITKLPHSPAYIRGVINLREKVMPVIDARKKFGLPDTNDTVNSCIVVFHISLDGVNLNIGTIVDAVLEVMDIQEANIQPVPKFGSKFKSEFILGMIKENDQFIMLLKPESLFSSEEVSILQEIIEEDKLNTEENSI